MAGRIYGNNIGTASVNYAKYDNSNLNTGVCVATSNKGYYDSPAFTVPDSTNLSSLHGANVIPGTGTNQLGTSAFWTGTFGFNSTAGGTGIWDFTNISYGYPKLAWE